MIINGVKIAGSDVIINAEEIMIRETDFKVPSVCHTTGLRDAVLYAGGVGRGIGMGVGVRRTRCAVCRRTEHVSTRISPKVLRPAAPCRVRLN